MSTPPPEQQVPTVVNPYSKIAVLLDAMGDEVGATVLQFMDANDIRRLGVNLPHVAPVAPETKDQVMIEFIANASNRFHEKKQALQTMYKKTLGLDPLAEGRISKSPKLAALEWVSPKAILEVIQNEHPQTIALILTYLNTQQTVSILTDLPPEMRIEVVMRMATLEDLPPAVIEEIMETVSEALADELKKLGIAPGHKAEKIGGVKFVANLLKEVDPAIARPLIDQLREGNAELAAMIKELMFVFEDIAKFDSASMQAAMKEIPKDKLSIALRIASQGVKDTIFQNMSQRAGQTLREDIEGRGAMKLSEVEEAQKAIVDVLVRMGDEGKITIGGKKSASDAMV